MDPLAPLPLESSKSINLSGNLSLSDFLKSNSLSDLGLGFGLGASFNNLDSALSFSGKNKDELRAANVSDLSLSGILGENASDLVANLSATPGGPSGSSGGGVPRQSSHNSSAGSAGNDGGGTQPEPGGGERDLVSEMMNDDLLLATC